MLFKKLLSLIFCVLFVLSLAACSSPVADGDTTSDPASTENVLGLQEELPEATDLLFNYGLACVKVGDKWGFINMKGEMVIEPQFDRMGKFYQGLYTVNENGTYRFMNTKGEWVNDPTPGSATHFTEGYCVVRKFETDANGNITSARAVLIDASGEVCCELPDGVAPWPVRDGMIFARSQQGAAVYTPQGEKLFEIDGTQTFAGDEETYRVFFDGLLCLEKDDKWGAVNTKGEWVIEPQFDDLDRFENGLARATVGEYYGYIDAEGEWVIEPQFMNDNYYHFSEGLVGAETDDKIGYIDAEGNWKIVLLGFEWANLGEFHEGIAQVSTDLGAGILKNDGTWILEPTYDHISKFRFGLAAVETDHLSYGFINTKGEIVVAPEYRYTAYYYQDGYAVAQKHDGKWVILDATGKVILDGGFDGIGNYETYYEEDGTVSMGYSR